MFRFRSDRVCTALALLLVSFSSLEAQITQTVRINNPIVRGYTSPPRPGKGQELKCSNPDWASGLTPGAKRVFRGACITHDFCYRHGYRTYNHSKAFCDSQMKTSMDDTCAEEYSGTVQRTECYARSETLYLGLRACIETDLLGLVEIDTGACAAFRDKGSRAVEYESHPMPGRNRINWPKLGDVNGDKRADLVYFFGDNNDATTTIRTKFSNSTVSAGSWSAPDGASINWSANIFTYPTVSGDFTGDKRMDLVMPYDNAGKLHLHLIRSNGDGQWTNTEVTTAVNSDRLERPTLEGDVNGDQISDLIFVTRLPSRAGLAVNVFLGSASGTWTSRSFQNTWTDVFEFPTLVGDVNGDGRADLIFPIEETNQQTLTVKSLISTSTGSFTEASQPIGWGLGVHPAMLGDINGDLKSDLLFAFEASGGGMEIRSLMSNGDGTWTSRTQNVGWGARELYYPTLVADINGDKMADLVLPYVNDHETVCVMTLVSRGDGTWSGADHDFGWGKNWMRYPSLIGDIDADGKADLLFPWHDGSNGLRVRYLSNFASGTWGRDQIVTFGDGLGILNADVP